MRKWGKGMEPETMKRYYYVKCILDYVITLLLSVFIWPIFLLITALIKLDSKGPVIFKQERLGQNGEVFKIYKFRTMVNGAVNIGKGLFVEDNDFRITKIGNFLRKTSLDEMPQIINILRGEMSIIGPRPPVPNYPREYKDYSAEQKARFLLKPGITGYAQIKVRNSATWDERILLDIEYVKQLSFKWDCYIFLKSIVVVLKKENIYRNVQEGFEIKENDALEIVEVQK